MVSRCLEALNTCKGQETRRDGRSEEVAYDGLRRRRGMVGVKTNPLATYQYICHNFWWRYIIVLLLFATLGSVYGHFKAKSVNLPRRHYHSANKCENFMFSREEARRTVRWEGRCRCGLEMVEAEESIRNYLHEKKNQYRLL